MNTLRVSIIICVYDDQRVIRCVESLSKQSVDKYIYEIIVVENGANGKFKDIKNVSKKTNIRYYYIPDKNRSRARDIGLSRSMGDIIAFTDSDCVIDKDWIKQIIRFFDDPKNREIGGMGGIIKKYKPNTLTEIKGKNLAWGQRKLQYLQICKLPYVVFANAAFRKKILLKTTSFDSELLSGNDVDICWKIGFLGFKLKINNKAIIYHHNRDNIKKYFKVYFRYATYQALLFKKYRKLINKKWMINTYPFILFKKVFKNIFKNKKINIRDYLDIIEGTATLFGQIYGSFKFKTIYL
jgi:glycosyltransferase involved in cell wall biosynthesis